MGTLNSWNPLDNSMPVTGLLYQFFFKFIIIGIVCIGPIIDYLTSPTGGATPAELRVKCWATAYHSSRGK
jgi:hypothetical protein